MAITAWSRIEPATSLGDLAPDLEVGIAARLADPLWLLARQWQLGELAGEDAGTPIRAEVAHAAFPIDRVDLGEGLVPLGGEPLETRVERSADPADVTLRTRGRLYFLDLLEEAGMGTLVPLAADAFADGDEILAAVAANTVGQVLGVAPTQALQGAVRQFTAWYAPRAGRTAGSTFVEDRLESRFRVALRAPEGDVHLAAPEHHGGRVDWATFDLEEVDPVSAASAVPTLATAIPLPVTVPGMPVVRFWELDDPQFDPGRIEVGRGDIARALLVELHLAFASDQFLLPLVVPTGALSRIVELAVTDTFGVRSLVGAAADAGSGPRFGLWRIEAADRSRALEGLLLASTVADGLEGPPLEELAIVRDQLANVAWVVARVVPDGPGQARPGFQGGRRVSPGVPGPIGEPAEPAALVYAPFQLPSAGFIPLILVEDPERRLIRAGRVDGLEPPDASRMVGPAFVLRDEELPPEGLVVGRRFELARTPDGTVHLWVARTKAPGATVPPADLGFDQLR